MRKERMFLGILLVLLFILLIWLITSIVQVHSSQSLDFDSQIKILDSIAIPKNIKAQFDSFDNVLRSILFEPIFYLEHTHLNDLTGYIRYYVNYAEKDTLMIVYFKQQLNNEIKIISYILT